MTITEFIVHKCKQISCKDLAAKLNITPAMITRYKNGDFKASYSVAANIYAIYGIVLEPYSKEGLMHHLNKEPDYDTTK